jgi:integrase
MTRGAAQLHALASPVRPPDWPSLLAAAVRPEFRVDLLFAPSDDPVLFGPPCPVEGCGHFQRGGHGFCTPHSSQFRKRGGDRSAGEWIALPPELGGPRPPRATRDIPPCGVVGCPRSAWNGRLCLSHRQRWVRTAGRLELDVYCATTRAGFATSRPSVSSASCAVAGCRFACLTTGFLCDGHESRFRYHCRRRAGYKLERFVAEIANVGRPAYDLEGLPEPLKSELQLGLQCMSDQRTTRLRLEIFGEVVRVLRARRFRSLLGAARRVAPHVHRRCVPFVIFVCERLEDLHRTQSGVEEWDGDTWRTDRLPIAHEREPKSIVLSFEFCQDMWLRELIKRWSRWRLSCGVGISATTWNLRGLRLFVEYCGDHGRSLAAPEDITRELLEGWQAHVLRKPVTSGTRLRWLGSLRTFLDDVRRMGWAPGLSATATYHRGELPRLRERAPRFLEERVITRLETDASLDRLPDLTTRTLVLILIETGLRAIDARRLDLDSLSEDAAGQPYLRYFNHKLSRERFMPITPRLADQIRDQQARARERFPDGDPCLLPRLRRNPSGEHPYTYGMLVTKLQAWARELDLRDANGELVILTAHRFRHTLATRMINKQVPQIVVQQMLDHDSPRMTNVYAKLHDQTLRAEFDRYQERVNIRGQVVTVAPELADAAWAKDNLARAKQTLPNGFCGLPLQQSCPHPNACLSCDHFLTSEEFLPIHHEQLDRTRELLGRAREAGQQRLVEMNEPIELNLIRIIDGLERLADVHDDADAA